MQLDDAIDILINKIIQVNRRQDISYTTYGYEVYISGLLRLYLQREVSDERERDRLLRELYPVFLEAGWELCRIGVLRPGIKELGGQATDQGNAGEGYTITSFGRSWLEEYSNNTKIPIYPNRYSELLSRYKDKFGSGFIARAQEADRSFRAQLYLACCVMCGASVESIMLKLASEKISEEEAMRIYRRSSGRRHLENLIIGQLEQQLQSSFRRGSELLNYWRDAASHGQEICISQNEAYLSLLTLLRFAIFVDDNWGVLVNNN